MTTDNSSMMDAVDRSRGPAGSASNRAAAPLRAAKPIADTPLPKPVVDKLSMQTPQHTLRPIPAGSTIRFHRPDPAPIAPDNGGTAVHALRELNPFDSRAVVGQYVTAVRQLPDARTSAVGAIAHVGQVLADPNLSPTQRVLAIRQQTQAAAKLLYTATALPAAWKSVAAISPHWISGLAVEVETSQCHRILTSVMNVARPIADGILLTSDAMNLHAKVHDDQATTRQVARAAVDVGIDSARLLTYLAPATSKIRLIGSATLFARMGLGLYDVWHDSKH